MIPCASREVKAGPRTPVGYQFRPLPVEHFADRKLSSTAKLLHAVLLDSARRRGACKLCNRTLAEMIGRSVATVKRLLSELERAGLASREMIAGGRVRLGIVPSAGVAHSRSGDARPVAQEQSRGGSPVTRGVAHSQATIQNGQREIQSGGILPLGEDAGTPPDPATAAAYLKACIEAGRRGVEPPPPPVLHTCKKPGAPVSQIAKSPSAPAVGSSPLPAPRYGDPRREVGVMVERLANGFKAGLVRPRRMSQQQLDRQLAEVRRRHGAGKAPPRA